MPYRNLRSLALAAGLLIAAASAQAQPAPAYDGLRKTISVDTFVVTDSVGSAGTAEGMTALLTDALSRDGRFVVVERTGPADAAGQIAASAVIRAAVTKFEANAGGSNLSVGGLPMGSLFAARAGVKSQKSVIEISLRLVDSATGQVVSTSRAQGVAAASGLDATLVDSRTGASASGGTFKNTPIGKAGEDAIAKAVEQIAAGMRTMPWSALVIDAGAGKVYVNAGADRNMQAGMSLHVYRKGKVFTDPATGVVLDVDLDPVGVIRVDGVRERLSTALVVSGGPPQRGDVLKLD